MSAPTLTRAAALSLRDLRRYPLRLTALLVAVPFVWNLPIYVVQHAARPHNPIIEIVSGAWNSFIAAGALVVALHVANQGMPKWRDMLSGMRYGPALLVCVIPLALFWPSDALDRAHAAAWIQIATLVPLVSLSLFLIVRLMLFGPAVVDNGSLREGLQVAWRAGSGHGWLFVRFVLAVFLLVGVPCGLLWLHSHWAADVIAAFLTGFTTLVVTHLYLLCRAGAT